jgi:NAD(P)-dependent dehydrogenase (short-subunit alcohol dehydrogenase family)
MTKKVRSVSIFGGKVAVITGAGSGIGKGLAEELARRGAHVVISDIDTERITKVAEGIAGSDDTVTALTVDVSNYEAVKKMIDDTVAVHGRLDYMFNNAGIAVGGPAKDFLIDDWRTVIDVNLYGVVHGAAVAYPLMVKQGFGHIVNTASIEGLAPLVATASYVTSKYGVVGLSSALRVEGAEHGVQVSVVCPGYVRTAIFTDSKSIGIDKQNLEEFHDWMGVSPEECARQILRGVERNDAFIIVTFFAKFLWVLNRISPDLVIRIMKREYRKAREKGILK